jgi:FkbM family methyltransferase
LEDLFFPNQPISTLELLHRFRVEVEKLPQPSRLILYEILSSCMPTLTPTKFTLSEGMVLASQNGRQICFSSPIPMVKLTQLLCGYEEVLRRKYCLPGFVEVAPGDVVVDCGAFVGGFSLSASRIAAQVHAFEPESRNFACLKRNFANVENVLANNVGLYTRSALMNLNISMSSVEHSLLAPDDGQIVSIQEIEVIGLKEYLQGRGIPKFDFVKIEAEGVELEVFDGLEDLRPGKLAIDVSPERNGESPADEFRGRLIVLGYEVRQRGHVMFARLQNRE